MVEIYAKAEEVLTWMGLNNTPILESLSSSDQHYLTYLSKKQSKDILRKPSKRLPQCLA